jgi:hypothetical protein
VAPYEPGELSSASAPAFGCPGSPPDLGVGSSAFGAGEGVSAAGFEPLGEAEGRVGVGRSGVDAGAGGGADGSGRCERRVAWTDSSAARTIASTAWETAGSP